ncbi:non-hydrolyzing UDP-N-acetylglucosamine 2-epimerase [Anoxynatronum buryatiense]|uniref:UDP-N-acetylglucosamine 2-epimerase (non-hydrolyzing) n=1 Tax=Anoxynatronum buryatiense TaxID=489973 RepID=A0AA46AIS8_9CLOT|nr:UDP-N-acetylglucosamine 2-epimerase (non-hydrolyzing) [Anoxynatronum buryatiense]SMP52329.1 UDP-N-Acetylglucosamine 2-epimerase [Anoxynatronum buryatiense]
MQPLKVLSVFGTRPEAIKMAPLVKMMEKDPRFNSRVCVTAQHREMLDSVLTLFDITPWKDLNIMKHGQSITDITVRTLTGLQEVLKEYRPDYLLVHGDTTTTFVASLAAFYEKIPVGHVEAGLRTGNIYSPYPEEMNRRLTGTLATLHFAPTQQNREHLLKENVAPDQIFITGNTVIDALLSVIQPDYDFQDEKLNRLVSEREAHPLVVMTCHRRENWGAPMEQIFEAVCRLARRYPHYRLIYPVHLNPAIGKLAETTLGREPNVHLIQPLDYAPFANLLNAATLILTDSGGIQEEAPALGKPILVMRTETERPEAVAAGTVQVTGVETETIFRAAVRLLDDAVVWEKMARAVNPYGDGQASRRIGEALLYGAGHLSAPPDKWEGERKK